MGLVTRDSLKRSISDCHKGSDRVRGGIQKNTEIGNWEEAGRDTPANERCRESKRDTEARESERWEEQPRGFGPGPRSPDSAVLLRSLDLGMSPCSLASLCVTVDGNPFTVGQEMNLKPILLYYRNT